MVDGHRHPGILFERNGKPAGHLRPVSLRQRGGYEAAALVHPGLQGLAGPGGLGPRACPRCPGSYYTPRHINNAFRAVCIKEDADEPRETILQYARIINDEIYDKRTEFGLPTEKR